MTTVCIDLKKRFIVSDSRSTWTDSRGNKSYKTNLKKIYKHPSGKIVAVTSGCLFLNYKVLKSLGFEIEENLYGKFASGRGDSGDILILNKYNFQVVNFHTEKKLQIFDFRGE